MIRNKATTLQISPKWTVAPALAGTLMRSWHVGGEVDAGGLTGDRIPSAKYSCAKTTEMYSRRTSGPYSVLNKKGGTDCFGFLLALSPLDSMMCLLAV